MRYITQKLFLFVLVCFGFIATAYGQYTTEGKDFYVTFGKNFTNTLSVIEFNVRVVATKATTVTFTFTNVTGAGRTVTQDIPENSSYTLLLDDTQETEVFINTSGVKSLKSLRIQSTEPVSIYALNQASAAADATNVLPVEALGVAYYHLGYTPSSSGYDGWIVIATEDNTKVYDNGTLMETLNAGEVYSFYYSNAISNTGRYITADKPIAYFVAIPGVQVPLGTFYIDCLFQQLMPVSTWGTRFFVPVTLRGIERVRIVASQDNTVITQTGGTVMAGIGAASLTLNKGQFVELEIKNVNNGCFIQSDKPIGVASFLMGSEYPGLSPVGGVKGSDPAMAWIPPVEQFLNTGLSIAPFVPKTTQLKVHYAIIVVPAGTESQTILSVGGDVTPLSGGSWVTNMAAGYSYYNMLLTNTTESYRFVNTNGMFLLAYGLGSAESYYYMAGASIRKLDISFDVNGEHYQDVIGRSLCDDDFTFQSKITLNNLVVKSLKWYIDGVENVAARDKKIWTVPKGGLLGKHTIKLVVTDDLNAEKERETTFTVLPYPAAPTGITTTPVCSGVPPVISIPNTQVGLTYKVYDNPFDGDMVGTAVGTGGTVNITCTTPVILYPSYSVTASNGDCESPRTPVTVSNLLKNNSFFTDRAWFFGTNVSGDKSSPGLVFDKSNNPVYSPNLTKVNSLGTNFSTNLNVCNNYNFYTSYNEATKTGLVYNYKHEVMEGGQFPAVDNTTDGYAGAYIGNNKYAFFTVSGVPSGNLNYYIVDVSANGGNGKVTLQKTVEANVMQGIELVAKCGTTNEYWLIYYESTSRDIKVALLSGETLTPMPANTLIQPLPPTSAIPVMVRSPQNNRIACLSDGGWNKSVAIFTFNTVTGEMAEIITVDVMAFGDYFSLSFTPDNDYCVVAYGPANTYLGVVDISTGGDSYAYITDASIVGGGPSIPFPQKGGGLKLGPDNIMYQKTDEYIFQLFWNKGSIQGCYAINNFIGDDGVNFSVGLTPPAVDPAGISENNTPPVAVDDIINYEIMNAGEGFTVSIYPTLNDTDAENNELFLNEVEFADPAEAVKGTFTIDYDTKEVFYKSLINYKCGETDKIILNYTIRDNTVLNSLCTTGQIIINVSVPNNYSDQATFVDEFDVVFQGNETTICPNTTVKVKALVSSGFATAKYMWYESQTADVPLATTTSFEYFETPQLTEQTTYYVGILVNDASCESPKDKRTPFTVNMKDVIQDYPDIRIVACAQNPIDLTKYVDSKDFVSVQWYPANKFANNGVNNGRLLDATGLLPGLTYTYKYAVTNVCGTDNQRNFYLTIDKTGVTKLMPSEIKVCYEQAEALQLNQLFGVEADGVWSCLPVAAAPYLTVNNTAPFIGAALFNGKAAWSDASIPFNGTNKEITIVYTPSATSCLAGKTYSVKIILTPDITTQ